MIRRSIILCFFLSSLSVIYSQTDLDTSAAAIRNEYAVPDAPAFNILDEAAGSILKPTSVKQLAFNLSDFLGEDEKITLPRSFAVEVSPGLLIAGNKLTLKEYRDNSWLYRIRVSLATKRDSTTGSASSLALGIRGSISDDSDLRTNPEYIKEATGLAEKIVAAIDTMKPGTPQSEIDAKREEIEQGFQNKWKNWSEEQWNANIVEWAIAFSGDSRDSLAEDLKFNKVSAWLSGALKVGSWGQLVMGLNAYYQKLVNQNKYKSNLSAAARFYAGMNKLKIYMHLQAIGQESRQPVWVFHSGMEVKLQKGLWADLYGGIQYGEEADNGKFITDFKLKYEL